MSSCNAGYPHNYLSTLLNGGRVVVYEDLLAVFSVAQTVGPTSLSLVPQLWAELHAQFLQQLEVHTAVRFVAAGC